MTIPEFLAVLTQRAPQSTWYLLRADLLGGISLLIRTTSPLTPAGAEEQCPLAYIAGGYSWDFHTFWEKLNMAHEDIMTIVDAADMLQGYDPTLRRQLLQAVGLEESASHA